VEINGASNKSMRVKAYPSIITMIVKPVATPIKNESE
jgi:hypothetical protein